MLYGYEIQKAGSIETHAGVLEAESPNAARKALSAQFAVLESRVYLFDVPQDIADKEESTK
jgi:hypothetical protein